jgi:hypothetical protein
MEVNSGQYLHGSLILLVPNFHWVNLGFYKPLRFSKSGASSKKTWYILVPPTPYNTRHSQLEITPESPLTGLNASAGASVGPLNVLPIAQPTLGQKQGTVGSLSFLLPLWMNLITT